jgi:ABC-type nitrate/sulfonate/bicarbonate transport system substrate-binding protein
MDSPIEANCTTEDWRQIKMASYRSSRRAFLGGRCAASTFNNFAIGQSREKVTFATSLLAQAEQGGYYQAVVDGTYLRHGLDVSILPGGPQSNNRMMFTVGRIDFYMGTNLLEAFSAVEQNIPTVVLAAMFQKDPQVLIAHSGQGVDKSRLSKRQILASRHLYLVSLSVLSNLIAVPNASVG